MKLKMKNKKVKKVMVFGTFDIFHLGHRNFLKQARKWGDFLIVVIARDKTVLKVKKQRPAYNEKERLRIVQESDLADKVISGNLKDKYAVIEKYRPDVICLGYDQKFFVDDLESRLKDAGLRKILIERMRPYKENIYKSSKLKRKICKH